ncbi:MAG: hypothetical protein J6K18_04210 [Bacilli bacterium]|nr:hypothetical protein [Bacilli bacterium]
MTEKDFRKLVTDLEFTKEDKEEVALFINNLETSLKENIKELKIKKINKAGNLAATTIYHGSKTLELMVVFEKPLINSFPLMNQAAINAVWNFLVFNYNLDKVNLISINNQTNSINYTYNNYNINLSIRFLDELNYQTSFFIKEDELRNAFVNLAGSEFNLFKNTVQILTYYRDLNNLDQISDYVIELLLYYGLSENFTKHTYEAYLKEFVHAVDDFTKGIKIDQDDETYRNLKVERVNLPKQPYMIIDIANPYINLTNKIGEAYLSELKKFKKIILKILEAK